jgi:putative transposase
MKFNNCSVAIRLTPAGAWSQTNGNARMEALCRIFGVEQTQDPRDPSARRRKSALAVVLDWFSRRVLSWSVSITMEASFCVETLEDALARHGKPDIFNTDQGSQFTGAAFTGVLIKNRIAISMDGKGAWRDNVFVERLWRSVKYEEVYLRAYDTASEARASIGRYLDFYNRRRSHSSLDGTTPDHAYFTSLPVRMVA